MSRRALYPGTFDPITNGHRDLVRRAAGIFDQVLVAIASNPGKTPMFTLEERVEMAQRVLADIPNVQVAGYPGLTVDFMRQHGIKIVVRGLRAVSDFEFEFQLANMQRHLLKDIETAADAPLPPLPAAWVPHRAGKAGEVGYHLLHAPQSPLPRHI